MLFLKAGIDATKRLYEKKQAELATKMSQMKVRVKPQMELVLKHKDDKDNAQAIEGAALSLSLPPSANSH